MTPAAGPGQAAVGASSRAARHALRDPAARRRGIALVLALFLLWPLMSATEFAPWRMLEARSLHASARFLAGFLPPAIEPAFLVRVARGAWQTVAIATSGIVLALLLAVPLSLCASASLSISSLAGRMAPFPFAVRQALRGAMVALRTVPELVWALLLVRVVGLGPTAGVLAIGLTYGGMLGKVYAEILESADSHAARTLLANGSRRLQAFMHGLLPEAAPELASYTVYRWECAIRSSVVLGFVGAGGLGQEMDSALKLLAGGEVMTLLLTFVGLVAIADGVSAGLRRLLQ